jgi:hypothetical protein
MNTKAALGACALLTLASLSTGAVADMKPAAASAEVVVGQGPSDVLASNIVGTTVYSMKDEKIGDIQYLVLGKDGRVEAAVIGVGGFLGVARKDVALNFRSLNISYDTDNSVKRITADVTKDALKAAPEYAYLKKS